MYSIGQAFLKNRIKILYSINFVKQTVPPFGKQKSYKHIFQTYQNILRG